MAVRKTYRKLNFIEILKDDNADYVIWTSREFEEWRNVLIATQNY
jgi:hypothetical protein